MNENTVNAFGIPQRQFTQLVKNAVKLYPIVKRQGDLILYDSESGKSRSFIPYSSQEENVLAEYIIFPEIEETYQFFNDYEAFQQNREPSRELMDEDALFFKIRDTGDQVQAIIESGGKYKDYSREVRGNLIKEFLLAADNLLKECK